MAAPAPPTRPYKWIEISDFTPGIISQQQLAGYYSTTQNSVVPGSKLGQAQPTTYGCIGLPNGGLAPLPGFYNAPWATGHQVAPNHTPVTGSGALNMINGLFLNGPINYYASTTPYALTQGDEILVGQINLTSGGTMNAWLDSLQIHGATATWTGIINPSPEPGLLPFCTWTGAMTRANATPADVGLATWFLSFWYTGGTAGEPTPGYFGQWNYPDVEDPTVFTPHLLGDALIGEAVCHQNRMILLTYSPSEWPSSSGWDTYAGGNDEFNYTEPPNSIAFGSQAEVFVQEDPSGYGAWGSISASELFLVKNLRGGVVISGDLNSPTVTWLPGVTPTYGLMSRTAQTPLGLIYASNNNGLWAWNGGNTSQKISNQLDDNFMINPANPPVLRGPTVDICRWGDWIVVSNDWLCDTNTGSWWKLPLGTEPHTWFVVSSDGNTLYAASPVPSSAYFMDIYNRTTPTVKYQWESYPIRSPDDGKNSTLVIREVVVRAIGYGTVAITLTGISPSGVKTVSTGVPSSTLTFETPTDQAQPTIQRQAIANSLGDALLAQDITINVVAQGRTFDSVIQPAPTIYSIAIGYEDTGRPVNAT